MSPESYFIVQCFSPRGKKLFLNGAHLNSKVQLAARHKTFKAAERAGQKFFRDAQKAEKTYVIGKHVTFTFRVLEVRIDYIVWKHL